MMVLHSYGGGTGTSMGHLSSFRVLVLVLFVTGCCVVSAKPKHHRSSLRSLDAAHIFGVKSFLGRSSGDECATENKNPGTCMSRVDCSKLDGIASGSCGYSGVCCEISMACGKVSRAKKTYIHNPSKIPSQCSYYFRPYSKHVCQLRFDFSSKLDSPSIPRSLKSHGYVECRDSYLQIGSFKLCGLNKNQHFYVPFKADKNEDLEIALNFIHHDFEKSGSNYWDMVVTQLECAPTKDDKDKEHSGWDWHLIKKKTHFDTDLIAPEGCLQYFTEPSGIVESFNYNNGKGPYLGNMRYAICFKKDPGDKKIVFEGLKFNLNSNKYNRDDINENCYDPKNKFSNGDYLLIPDSYLKTPYGIHPKIKTEASKYCGTILERREVYYAPAGPFIITVNFDKLYKPYGHIKERGFKIRYSIFTGVGGSDFFSDKDDKSKFSYLGGSHGSGSGSSGHSSSAVDHYASYYYPWAHIYDYPWHLKPGSDDDDSSRPGGGRPPSGGGSSGGGRPPKGGGGSAGGGGRPPSGGSGGGGNPGRPFVLFEDEDQYGSSDEFDPESVHRFPPHEDDEDIERVPLDKDDDEGGHVPEDGFRYESDDDKDEADEAVPDFFKSPTVKLRPKGRKNNKKEAEVDAEPDFYKSAEE